MIVQYLTRAIQIVLCYPIKNNIFNIEILLQMQAFIVFFSIHSSRTPVYLFSYSRKEPARRSTFQMIIWPKSSRRPTNQILWTASPML